MKHTKTIMLVALVLSQPLVLAAAGLNASVGYDITRITNADGLSNSSVTVIFQGSQGRMWFGTWDGLDCYNSIGFKVYKPKPDDPESISNNIIRDIFEQGPDTLWIATDNGINRMSKNDGKFTRWFFSAGGRNVPGEHAFLIAKSNTGDIYANVYGQGLFLFDKNAGRFHPVGDRVFRHARNIFFDNLNRLWCLDDDGNLYCGIHKPEPIAGNISKAFTDDRISFLLLLDKNGRYSLYKDGVFTPIIDSGHVGKLNDVIFTPEIIYFGSENGVFRFNRIKRTIDTIIGGVPILSLHKGSQGIIWAGTDMQGVLEISTDSDFFIRYPEPPDDFDLYAVRTFGEDRQGNLWTGTKGNGVFVLSPNMKIIRHYSTHDGLQNNAIFSIAGTSEEMWLGGDGTSLNYFSYSDRNIHTLAIPDSLKESLHSVYAIFPDGENLLWVGTSGNGIYKLAIDRSKKPYGLFSAKQFRHTDSPNSLGNDIVYAIIRDDAGHLLVGTRGGGVNQLDLSSETFVSRGYEDDVLSICKDSKNTLWIGTSLGLYRIGEDGRKLFTEDDGLPNNTIHGILEDEDGHLWLSTNRGICRFRLLPDGSPETISYSYSDGLQDNEFSDGAYYRNPAGRLYFGGIGGFNAFYCKDIPTSAYMPTLLSEGFNLDNEPAVMQDYMKDSTLVLDFTHRSFSMDFIPVDYRAGDKCLLSYRLDGRDKDWIDIGSARTIVCSSLPSGKYTLLVRYSDRDKVWSKDIFTLPIRITPPWWKSIPANIMYFLLFVIITGSYTYSSSRRRHARVLLEEEQREKEKMKEIQESKLAFFTNIAHEVSNSLTLIIGPCEQLLQDRTIPSSAQKYLKVMETNSDRMQSLMTQLLEFRKAETGHLKISIRPIDIVALTISVTDNFKEEVDNHRIDFKTNFSSNPLIWNTDFSSLEKILFNLISNAFKYTPSGEKISIDEKLDGDALIITVENTGIGISEDYRQRAFDLYEVINRFEKALSHGHMKSTGIGLAMCKNLVELLHGSISLESDEVNFTRFIVRLPLLKADTAPEEPQDIPDMEKERQEEAEEQIQEEEPMISNSGKYTVLVVDDDAQIRSFIIQSMKSQYNMIQASTGVEALKKVREQAPNLVICDMVMPEMDGVSFVKAMKRDESARHIPIIMLSAKTAMDNQIESIESGADIYLTKPFNPRHLRATIKSLLDRDKAMQQYENSPLAATGLLAGKTVKKEDKELIARLTNIITVNISNGRLSVDYLADELSISSTQLYRKVKDLLDLTPVEYIRNIRLQQAEKMLRTGNRTIQEIMFDCGFSSKAYFFKVFGERFGCTPKEYRLKEREKK